MCAFVDAHYVYELSFVYVGMCVYEEIFPPWSCQCHVCVCMGLDKIFIGLYWVAHSMNVFICEEDDMDLESDELLIIGVENTCIEKLQVLL